MREHAPKYIAVSERSPVRLCTCDNIVSLLDSVKSQLTLCEPGATGGSGSLNARHMLHIVPDTLLTIAVGHWQLCEGGGRDGGSMCIYKKISDVDRFRYQVTAFKVSELMVCNCFK